MAALKDKVIALTGASGGIGSATAVHLAAKGANLSLADVDITTLETLAQQLRNSHNGHVMTTQLDVTNTTQVDDWIIATKDQFGKLDGAANIAGTVGKEFGYKLARDVSDEDFDMVMVINVRGVMACQRAQLQNIEEGGAIVNVASVAGKMGQPTSLSYTASKHAVIGLTRVAASENGHRNVRVNVVAPGSIDTPMLSHALGAKMPSSGINNSPMSRAGRPEEVAALISFLLSPDSSFINGSLHTIDGGLTP